MCTCQKHPLEVRSYTSRAKRSWLISEASTSCAAQLRVSSQLHHRCVKFQVGYQACCNLCPDSQKGTGQICLEHTACQLTVTSQSNALEPVPESGAADCLKDLLSPHQLPGLIASLHAANDNNAIKPDMHTTLWLLRCTDTTFISCVDSARTTLHKGMCATSPVKDTQLSNKGHR